MFIRLLYLLIISIFITSCDERKDIMSSNSIPTYEIKIINHYFVPSVVEVPSNQRIKLIIENFDIEAEEFESFSLRREKIIPGKSKVSINIGPLAPGEHFFFGEFHINTAKGTIIAK